MSVHRASGVALRFGLIAALLALLALGLFGQETKITKEGDATVVRNPKAPDPSLARALTLKEDLVIGASGGEASQFSSLQSVQVDNRGNIAVLDIKEAKVKIFDAAGKLLRAFGKKGQGPGEWQLPTRLTVAPNGDLFVYDPMNTRLGRFSQEGVCLQETSVGKLNITISRLFPDHRGGFYADLTESDREAGTRTLTLARLDGQMNVVRRISTETVGIKPMEIDPMMDRFSFYALPDGGLVWAFPKRYEINTLDHEGKLLRKVTKDFEPFVVDAAERARIMKETFGEKGVPPGIAVAIPKAYSPIGAIIPADDGRLFVRTTVRDKRDWRGIDVFDVQGRFVAELYVPPEELLFVAKGDHLYFLILENEDGIPVIKRYAMIWR